MLLFKNFNNTYKIGNNVHNIYIWCNWSMIEGYISWLKTRGFHFGGIVLLWVNTNIRIKRRMVLIDGYRGESGLSTSYIVRNSISCIKFYSEQSGRDVITKRMIKTASPHKSDMTIVKGDSRRFGSPIKVPSVKTNVLLNPYCLIIEDSLYDEFDDILNLHTFSVNIPCLVCFKLGEVDQLKLYFESLENNNLTYNGLAFYHYESIYLYASTNNLYPYDVFNTKCFTSYDFKSSIYLNKNKLKVIDILSNIITEKVELSYFGIHYNKKTYKEATVHPTYIDNRSRGYIRSLNPLGSLEEEYELFDEIYIE